MDNGLEVTVLSKNGSAVDESPTNIDNGHGTETQPQNNAPNFKVDLSYSIEDVPPWYMCLILGFQHYLTMFGATVAIPLILATDLCMASDPVATGQLIGTIFFTSGMSTMLQTTFGNRLPIVQGGTFAFIAPAKAILSADGPCLVNATAEEETEYWQSRMRVLQGAIIVSSLFEIFIGFTGMIGLVMRFIGPLTIAPTIALIGLSLFDAAAFYAGSNWILAIITIVLMIAFSQYMSSIQVPIITYSFADSGIKTRWLPLFRLFPVIFAIAVAWIIAAILTATNVFKEGDGGRTDGNTQVLKDSAWFYFPYPGQWGIPEVTIAGVFGMLAGVLASMIESVGDYYACARLSGAPPPPDHAVNRGIGVEGFGCLLAGLWGSGNGTTSYSENIGAIGITKVGSRRVIQAGALFMLFLGMFAKFGALFVTIPNPIIGGMFCTLFGVIAAVGLSNLQFVNLNSSRNLFVLGFSLFMGFVIPGYMKSNPYAINTGLTGLDQVITVLLSTSMFVGGLLAAVLDNTLPGSDEDRGIKKWRRLTIDNQQTSTSLLKCYDIPFGMNWIKSVSFFRYLPFSPTFTGWRFLSKQSSGDDNGYPPNDSNVTARQDSRQPITVSGKTNAAYDAERYGPAQAKT